jgi:anti-anti-sigma regulatory factor
MWRIQKSASDGVMVFTLSGRIEAEHLAELQRLLETEDRRLVLDLSEIELVDAETVKFLARREAAGNKLNNCPAYIRAWMARERDGR